MSERSINRFKVGEPSRVSGKVLHVHEPFTAPLSKRKCVAYLVTIEQKKSTGKSSYWDVLLKEERVQDFFVEKHGEVVMVRPSKAANNYEIVLEADFKRNTNWLNHPSPEFEALLNNYNIKSTSFMGFTKNLRYKERILEVGEEVTVGGIARWKSVSEPIENYSYGSIAALEGGNESKILITDIKLPKKRRI